MKCGFVWIICCNGDLIGMRKKWEIKIERESHAAHARANRDATCQRSSKVVGGRTCSSEYLISIRSWYFWCATVSVVEKGSCVALMRHILRVSFLPTSTFIGVDACIFRYAFELLKQQVQLGPVVAVLCKFAMLSTENVLEMVCQRETTRDGERERGRRKKEYKPHQNL